MTSSSRTHNSEDTGFPRRRLLVIFVALLIVAVGGAIVYLRYFYGDDAPPPFELSSVTIGGAFGFRRFAIKRNQRRVAAASLGLAALLALAPGASAAKAKPKAKGACTKAGSRATATSGVLRCTKVGKKLVWVVDAATTSTTPGLAGAAAGGTTKASTRASSPAVASTNGPEGLWKTSAGSAAGYRVRELFVGGIAKVDAVGRTEAVSGTVKLVRTGSALTAQEVNVKVDTTKITSDESRRDGRMRTTGLETEKFPTAAFVASGPITLPDQAEKGEAVKLNLPGKLTLHGVTRDVEFDTEARLRSGVLEVVGRLGIKLPDYGIEPPEIVDFVKADDDGTIEFKLVLAKA